ncbi:TetR/AcrR family transcriptional regulator [Burkholderia gladioli]|uniref:TetR/AcrR family transcriptional regulator n=1 Tax=Burkholderia gladioli TaxID=28095 RepID=UPI00163FA9E2|nr:TetR/AcrR family transcriptional regulator C-terminal domain-containing protein [Burkholderia gladioli]
MQAKKETPVTRVRGERAGLDLLKIMEATRTLDAAAISMQSLADVLNVDRKALHYHVKDRQSLLQLIAMDRFSRQFSDKEIVAAENWQEACRRFARGFVDGVLSIGSLAEHLWFGDLLIASVMKPAEALFQQFHKASFADEVTIRLTTMLATICLGHARDIIQSQETSERPRAFSLARTLESTSKKEFANLRRISKIGVNTYTRQQLDFSLDVFISGAELFLKRK